VKGISSPISIAVSGRLFGAGLEIGIDADLSDRDLDLGRADRDPAIADPDSFSTTTGIWNENVFDSPSASFEFL